MAINNDLLRSHDELRAALRLAIDEIKRLQFGNADSPLLDKLRSIGTEARVIADTFRDSLRRDDA